MDLWVKGLALERSERVDVSRAIQLCSAAGVWA